MAINPFDTQPLFKKVLELGFKPNTYAIFGSGPLFAHDLIHEVHDVDIIVTTEGWRKSQLFGELNHTSSGAPVIRIGDGIEIFDLWAPGEWNVSKLIEEAKIIFGLPFVRLESVLAWKKLRNEPKDQKHIELIEQYLKKDK